MSSRSSKHSGTWNTCGHQIKAKKLSGKYSITLFYCKYDNFKIRTTWVGITGRSEMCFPSIASEKTCSINSASCANRSQYFTIWAPSWRQNTVQNNSLHNVSDIHMSKHYSWTQYVKTSGLTGAFRKRHRLKYPRCSRCAECGGVFIDCHIWLQEPGRQK